MQVETILNRVDRHKRFAYGRSRFGTGGDGEDRIEAPIVPRRNSQPLWSGSGAKSGACDRLEERCFDYVPLWGGSGGFLYCLRRADCPRCGVKVERPSLAGRRASRR